jgi:hypothetical protein
MIAVQIVQINWTKATRGAPRANERAVLNRALLISNRATEKYSMQHFRMDEKNNFNVALLAENASAQLPKMQGSLVLKIDQNDALILGLRWQSDDGQPSRHPRPEVIQLKPNEYAQLIMNGRHTSYSGQHYTEHIYNVAYGDNIAADRFLNCQPEHEFSLADNLF